MILYRANAYRLQRLNTPPAEFQPEMFVFFEAKSAEEAPATLLRLLALAWGCEPSDIEFYNLNSEAELVAASGSVAAAGDARLLEIGWSHGPLFARMDRTMMLARPLTQMRLLRARQAAVPLQALQRARSVQAAGGYPAGSAQRQRDLHNALEATSTTEMGGLC
jgi:hypothetical protein